MDDGKQATRQHEARTSMEQRPTLLDLWRRHPEIQNSRMIEAPGIPYIKVAYAFCGFAVTQGEFEAVLTALNRLAGTTYRQDDIAGMRIVSRERERAQ